VKGGERTAAGGVLWDNCRPPWLCAAKLDVYTCELQGSTGARFHSEMPLGLLCCTSPRRSRCQLNRGVKETPELEGDKGTRLYCLLLTVVGSSLSCLLWLNLAAGNKAPASRSLIPPSRMGRRMGKRGNSWVEVETV